jgi:flagellar protein FlbD
MITLHRLGRLHDPFLLNPDLISTVEARPDTVVTLTTLARVVVSETPEEIVEEIRAWRSAILSDALHRPEALIARADDLSDRP